MILIRIHTQCPHCGQKRDYIPRKNVIGTGYLKGKRIDCFRCGQSYPVHRGGVKSNIIAVKNSGCY